MTVAMQLEELVTSAVGAVGTAVVTVGRGSGVVIAEGHVLTNAHNLFRDLAVTFADGRRSDAQIVGMDADGDLAVLAVDTADATPAVLAEEAPPLGRPIVALARPARRGLTATLGSVSAVDVAFRGPGGRLVRGAIEHSARLPRGSSGGPVVDDQGRIVAIDTHRRSDGFYVAVPASQRLRQRIDQLLQGVSPRRARLGVAVAPPPVAGRLRSEVGLEPRDGLLVREIEEGSAADRAGIKVGDLLVSVDGTDLTSPDVLHDALTDARTLTFGVVRGDEEREVAVDLTEPQD